MGRIFLKAFLIFLPCFILAGCIHLGAWNRGAMYGKIENLHINEEISYPDSPFGKLVEETFPRVSGVENNPHYINVLDIGDEALLSRIHLIRCAKKAIYIQTFIWSDDEAGRWVAYELIEAARRGVKVKIIVDQWRKMKEPSLAAFMSVVHPNLEIKNYNPPAKQINSSALRLIGELAFKFKQVNQRMHNKTFIIDDRIAITGGRNYENDYYDRGATRNFKDRDVIVTGKVVRDITDSFMQYWAFKLSVPTKDLIDVGNLIKKDKFKKFKTKESYETGHLFDKLDLLASDKEHIRKTFIDTAFRVNKVKFVSDIPGKNNTSGLAGGGIAGVELGEILSQAKKSIVAQTPYLVLDHRTAAIVKKLRRQNPDVDIMISSNSLAATDSIYAYAFSYKQKKLFVKHLRFRIFELKPVPEDIGKMMPSYSDSQEAVLNYGNELPAHSSFEEEDIFNQRNKKHICIHAKSFVVDNRISWIGSYNVDPRSAHLNTEVGLIIWDEAVARALSENILKDMSPRNSWTIGKARYIPGVSLIKEFAANILQYVPFVDVWPFRYTASFELKEGKEAVPFYQKDFYKNYRSVGPFPQVSFSIREVQIRLLKMFGGIITPII